MEDTAAQNIPMRGADHWIGIAVKVVWREAMKMMKKMNGIGLYVKVKKITTTNLREEKRMR